MANKQGLSHGNLQGKRSFVLPVSLALESVWTMAVIWIYCPERWTMAVAASLPDLNAIGVFVKIVELGSFRGAARALGLPKSTVSAKLSQLETQVGVRLIERTTRSLRLTDAGEAYRRQAAAALDTLEEASRQLEGMRAEPRGRLRVTASLEGGQFLLGPVLAEYARRHPAVQLEVELTDRHLDIVKEGFDVALRAGPLPDSTLVARRLAPPGALGVYASAAYLRGHPPLRRPEQLADRECLVMTSHSRPRHWLFRVKRKLVSVEVPVRAAANSFVLLAEMAAAGLGVARLPDYIARAPPRKDELRAVLVRFAPEPIDWHAVYPSSRNLSAKVRLFVDLLEQQFRR
jgi:DNA-binding transcriptional LysR family regulator